VNFIIIAIENQHFMMKVVDFVIELMELASFDLNLSLLGCLKFCLLFGLALSWQI
jgi:hypothetical protein